MNGIDESRESSLDTAELDTGDSASQVIDVHVHALPVSLLDEVSDREVDGVSASRVDGGWRVSVPGDPQPKLVRPRMADAGQRAAWSKAQGLTSQVVSPWLDAQPTGAMPATAARDWARRLNIGLAEQEHGNAVLATVALTGHAAQDLENAIRRDGMAGLVLSTNPPGVADLADPALEGLWETAAGLGVPVVLHPPSDGPARALPGSDDFGNTFCRLVDTTFAVTRLLLSGVLDRYPGLRLIVVHGGGFLPYQSMRLDGGHRADALSRYAIERDRPSDYAADLFFDTVAMKSASIRFLADSAGAGHVLLGSDYPFPLGDPAPVATVRDAGLGEAATAAVLGGNAARLFPTAIRSAHA
jgi:aminocarboxymuconate-semialdehyde decarboxylase